MPHLIVFLAEGFEEIEAITVIDILRRADITVTTVSVGEIELCAAHNIVVKADTTLAALPKVYDGIVLPGGKRGTQNLLASLQLLEIVGKAFANGLLCAAICGAPAVFGKVGILRNIRATCYPGCEDALTGAKYIEAAVVRDKNVVTSRGAGTAIPFALELVSILSGEEMAERIRTEIVYT